MIEMDQGKEGGERGGIGGGGGGGGLLCKYYSFVKRNVEKTYSHSALFLFSINLNGWIENCGRCAASISKTQPSFKRFFYSHNKCGRGDMMIQG